MQLEERVEKSSLTSDEFNDIMAVNDIGLPSKIAVAVSGGCDSLSLTLLLRDWCNDRNIELIALTVDHGLRSESKQEAVEVGSWLKQLGINHQILKWVGEKPDTNVQNEARNARYSLMGQWCADQKVKQLFLAHHKNDQAETFLLRLFRGSGVDGLSAMETVASFPIKSSLITYPLLYRPLLNIPKERLEAYLIEKKQSWIKDPSNENRKFTRIQIRELLGSTDIDGLNMDRLAATADRMRRVRSFLEDQTRAAESTYVVYNELGYASLKDDFFQVLHEEISLRLLSIILKKIGGSSYSPRHKKLEQLLENIKLPDFPGQTLAGVMIFRSDNNVLIFSREINKISDHINVMKAKKLLWDKRFVVSSGNNAGQVVAINNDIISVVLEDDPDFKERLNNLFKNHQMRDRIVPSLPCIVELSGRVILPYILLNNLGLFELNGFSADFKE